MSLNSNPKTDDATVMRVKGKIRKFRKSFGFKKPRKNPNSI